MNVTSTDKLVLVTRPQEQADSLVVQLEQRGISALSFPVLAIKPVNNQSSLQQALDHIRQYDILIFISVNAVHYTFTQYSKTIHLLPDQRILAIGSATAKALAEYGLVAKTPLQGSQSEALLQLPELQSVQACSILIVGGLGGRALLQEILISRGARVHKVASYQRVPANSDPRILQSVWSSIDSMVVTSGESLQQLVDLLMPVFGEELRWKRLVVISDNMLKLARKLQFQSDIFVAEQASEAALLKIIEAIYD